VVSASRGSAADAIADIPDIDGPSDSPRMPTKQLANLSLDADTSITSIPDMDEIPDMEEEGLEGVDDAATAAPVTTPAV
jgi:ubiquitin-like-conjugating enzyme ATG3